MKKVPVREAESCEVNHGPVVEKASTFFLKKQPSHGAVTSPRGKRRYLLASLRHIFVCFVLAFFALTGTAKAQDPLCNTPESIADRNALAELYDATKGGSWARNNNWKDPSLNSSWDGVAVDANCRVTKLNLTSNRLEGPIPTELGNLASLTWLDLSYNRLEGPIPTELGNLASLTQLELSGNKLTGTIPTELGNLTSLTLLGLSSNMLEGTIPTELRNLTSLEYLYLNNNMLKGTIPTELGDLTSLKHLFLYSNMLKGTIPDLSALTGLQWLHLSSNRLEGPIPTELGT